MTVLTGKFTIKSWAEEAHKEPSSGQKSHTADVVYATTGDMVGTLSGRYVLHYINDGLAHYAGTLIFEGKIGDKPGTFALIETGKYANKSIKAEWQIVPQSGTSELTEISGNGGFQAPESQTVEFSLSVEEL